MNLLLESAVKASVLLFIALAALFLLRRQSAALRHWLLAVSLLFAAAQPALTLLLPTWSIAVPPASQTIAQPPDVVPSEVSFEVVVPAAAPIATRSDWRGIAIAVWVAGALINITVLLIGISRLA